MESSPEHRGADSSSTRQVVTFYSSTAEEVEQHFTRALARLRSQSPHLEEGASKMLNACGIYFVSLTIGCFDRVPTRPIAAEASSVCEVWRAHYGSGDAVNRSQAEAFAYPQFVPFIVEPDIDVTREVIRFPEEADECVSYSSRAHFILSNASPQSYGETTNLHSCPEFQSSYSEPASSRSPAHHEGLLDPLGLLSDAELLRVLMNC